MTSYVTSHDVICAKILVDSDCHRRRNGILQWLSRRFHFLTWRLGDNSPKSGVFQIIQESWQQCDPAAHILIWAAACLGSIHNLSRGLAMMISSFFPFIFLKPPRSSQGFFSDPPPLKRCWFIKGKYRSRPPPPHPNSPSTQEQHVKLTLSHIKVLWPVYWALLVINIVNQ